MSEKNSSPNYYHNDDPNNLSNTTSSTSNTSTYQRQTILNLYNCGITAEIISQQLDISQEEVNKIIEGAKIEEDRKKISAKVMSETPSLSSSFYLQTVVDIDSAIKKAQSRIWQALKAKPEFTISFESTQKVLEKFAESKVILAVLHIDLVGSTRLSMILPVDRLATIIQAFYQEMSEIITVYGGYVLKFVGDAIIAFFIVSSDLSNVSLSTGNSVFCAKSMIKIIQQGINPILNQYDYPEINVRIGIDIGEHTVILSGWDIHHTETHDSSNNNGGENTNNNSSSEDHFYNDKRKGILTIKKPIYDIIGYTINIATKMTTIAKLDQIVIGQLVYDSLDNSQKATFKRIYVDPKIWDYVSDYTAGIYSIYGSIDQKPRIDL
jgi:adenylate cyclase